MTTNYTLRPLNPTEDFPALVELINLSAQEETEELATTEEEQRSLAELPGHDPEKDTWVAVAADDTFLGYADVWRPPETSGATLSLTVHSEYRQQGIGRALLEQAQTRARDLGATALEVYAAPEDPRTLEWLKARGFSLGGAYRSMTAELGDVPNPALPTGFTLHTFEEVWNETVLANAIEQGHAGLFGHNAVTEAGLETLLEAFDFENILLLFDAEGEVAGYCKFAPLEEGEGYLDAPGVVPEQRRPELYRALATAALQQLQVQECDFVTLESWGDSDEVIEVYRGLGFDLEHTLLGFTLPLTSGTA